MANKKYLYGAAVQGIQGYIFQTNELKDIVGASELVERICKEEFLKYQGKGHLILQAAGNIKCIYDDEQECRRVVLNFPKKVNEIAPGITFSQAVVCMEGELSDFSKAIDKLEEKLKVQRNKQETGIPGLMGMLRSRKTGLPAVIEKEGEYLDYSTIKKKENGSQVTTQDLCAKNFSESVNNSNIAFNIEDLTGYNDWIAIVHIDGNNLGKVVQKIGKNPDVFSEFSTKLDEATTLSAVDAFKSSCGQSNGVIPVRPIVLGGDDHTLICRGDIAFDYVTAFLEAFERHTGELLGDIFRNNGISFDHLTACAGIAFIKSSYPFYYGYELAEDLCSAAKKDAKNDKLSGHVVDGLPQSCFMFHKVQDSFTESYGDIVKRELTPSREHSFNFGPYYLKEIEYDRWTVEKLSDCMSLLQGKTGNAVKSHLRQWMTHMHDNPEFAQQKADRIKSLLPNGELKEFVEEATNGKKRDNVTCYPVYDVLSLFSIINQVTK